MVGAVASKAAEAQRRHLTTKPSSAVLLCDNDPLLCEVVTRPPILYTYGGLTDVSGVINCDNAATRGGVPGDGLVSVTCGHFAVVH